MVEKATNNAQQTTKNGQAVTTTFNGQKKKMKNSTVFKTVLAPNAPWPEWETVEKKSKLGANKVSKENYSLDDFLKTYEAPNYYKAASSHRTRDKLSGRFQSNRGLEK